MLHSATNKKIFEPVVKSGRSSIYNPVVVEETADRFQTSRTRPLTSIVSNGMTERTVKSPMYHANNEMRTHSANKAYKKGAKTIFVDNMKRLDRGLSQRKSHAASVPEFRIKLTKNSRLKNSHFLQSIVSQNVKADIALSPYTLTLQSAGLKIRPVKKRNQSNQMVPTCRMSVTRTNDDGDQLTRSTQHPQTENFGTEAQTPIQTNDAQSRNVKSALESNEDVADQAHTMSSLNNNRQRGNSKSKFKNKKADKGSRYLNNFATTSMFASGISINEPGENATAVEP